MEFPSQTIAAIDIGTNSVHMVIAEMNHVGEMRVLDSDKVTLRLGAAIDDHGMLTEDGIRRTVEALRHMNEIIIPYKAITRAVATHATREAQNHKQLLQEIEQTSGIHVEMIDGIEEARLGFLGVRYGLNLSGMHCLSVDVGGGSSEIIIAKDDDIDFVSSFKMGAVTLTDRYFSKMGYSHTTVKALKEDIRSRLSPLSHETETFTYSHALASSGTAKALAFLHAKIFAGTTMTDPNGYILPSEDLFKINELFAKYLTPQKIKEETGLDQSRSEIIFAGSLILEELTKQLHVKEWVVTSYGLREGLVADTFYRIYGDRSHELPDIQWHSVLQFARRLRIDESHALQVKKLSLKLYELLAPLVKYAKKNDQEGSDHGKGFRTLTSQEHLNNVKLLKATAYLREAGKFLSAPHYHHHSQYLITHSRLPGFMESERILMGLIARFQRKGIPANSHEDCKELSGSDIRRLRFLSGILRLAASLDRTRQNRVKNISVDPSSNIVKLVFYHEANFTPDVELHKAKLEISAIEKSFDLKLQFELRAL